jgi:ribosome-associated heat shock protein Hsp15
VATIPREAVSEAAAPTVAADVRLDKWLWAARCFKTRGLAAEACDAGHVKVNGHSCKPAKSVRVGDRIEARTPGGLRVLDVAALADRRGPAEVARALYLDHSPPPPPRDPMMVTRERGTGRPSKRERRRIDRLRGV